MPATTISIATHKGGTGKTVSAMAISSALARAGKKTLLVDLDPQGHGTSFHHRMPFCPEGRPPSPPRPKIPY